MRAFRITLTIAITALFAVGLAGLAEGAPKGKKKGKETTRPAEVSRSNKPPSAYHVFLETPKDKANLDKKGLEEAKKALGAAFVRPGYVLDSPEENAPTDHDELAKWLRDKDRTGLRLDVVIDPLKESMEGENKRFDASVRATVYTYPSGWLIMSTSGSAAAVSDGWSSDEDLKKSAIAAAMAGMVENVAAYLTKKPVPIDR